MSKIRELVEARRAELLAELAECDEFLGIPSHASHGTAADIDAMPLRAAPSDPVTMSEEQLAALLARARATSLPMARPRGASEAILDAALNGATHLSNGLPAINRNDRLVTDPATGSVTRLPNGANQ